MSLRTSATNRVLAGIPAGGYRRLRAHLQPVTLNFGDILYEPGESIRHVYFPLDCLISLLTAVDKRRNLEVGMVGNEGMAGMPVVLGVGLSGVRALVQGGGRALRMGSRASGSSSRAACHCSKHCSVTPTHSWRRFHKPRRATAFTAPKPGWRAGC